MAAPALPCPPPFLNLASYPYTKGQEQSRFCAPIDQNTTCCLPCPVTDWVYPDNFKTVTNAANWVGMCSFVFCALLILSFVVLPARKTSRHYLTVCLILAVSSLTFGFVVSLGAQPDQCHDAITPNNMESDLACAFSGSFVLFGGMAAVIWVFIRSLSLHLQICWQIVPGRKFFWSALLGGWGIPSLFLALSLALSGVSYRFGPICHINHDYSLGTFWGPVLGFTGLAAAFQFVTLGYCIRVYLRSLMVAGEPSATSSTAASSTLPSLNGSLKPVSARAAYRRVRKVITLQWRGVMVVIILIVSAAYFSVIFLKLDSATVATKNDPQAALPWLTCLYLSGGDKDKCLGQASELILGEPSVATVLYLLAFMGFWCVLFLGRWSMLEAWWDIVRRPFSSDTDNWISADARRMSDPRNYEMLTAPPQQFYMAKGPSGLIATTSVCQTERAPTIPSATAKESLQGGSRVRDLASSRLDVYPAGKSGSIQKTVRMTTPDAQIMETASPNTGRVPSREERVTLDHDTPTPAPVFTISARTRSSSEFYTPHNLASPSSPSAADQDYFRQPRTGSTANRNGERSDSALSGRQDRGAAVSGRNWYGLDHNSSHAGTMDRRPSGRGTLRDWDPQSTFAQSNVTRDVTRGEAFGPDP